MKLPINKMPTTLVLLALSWVFTLFGVLMSGFMLFFAPAGPDSLILGLSILLGALFLASVLRMLANIGQILFDVKDCVIKNHQGLEKRLEDHSVTLRAIKDNLEAIRRDSNEEYQAIQDNLKNIAHDVKGDLEKISCDSKDINQNIGQIKIFFEKIERHLDLRK